MASANTGHIFLDGNELTGPFTFKKDTHRVLLDAYEVTPNGPRQVMNLVLLDTHDFVHPDLSLPDTIRNTNDLGTMVGTHAGAKHRAHVPDSTIVREAAEEFNRFKSLIDTAYTAPGADGVRVKERNGSTYYSIVAPWIRNPRPDIQPKKEVEAPQVSIPDITTRFVPFLRMRATVLIGREYEATCPSVRQAALRADQRVVRARRPGAERATSADGLSLLSNPNMIRDLVSPKPLSSRQGN